MLSGPHLLCTPIGIGAPIHTGTYTHGPTGRTSLPADRGDGLAGRDLVGRDSAEGHDLAGRGSKVGRDLVGRDSAEGHDVAGRGSKVKGHFW
jgi:hypothetical protein